jgi:hypothetical protein
MTTFYNYCRTKCSLTNVRRGEGGSGNLFNDNIGQYFAYILYIVHRAVHVRFCMYMYVHMLRTAVARGLNGPYLKTKDTVEPKVRSPQDVRLHVF